MFLILSLLRAHGDAFD